eukprot:1227811-Amphidinium_carterae.1
MTIGTKRIPEGAGAARGHGPVGGEPAAATDASPPCALADGYQGQLSRWPVRFRAIRRQVCDCLIGHIPVAVHPLVLALKLLQEGSVVMGLTACDLACGDGGPNSRCVSDGRFAQAQPIVTGGTSSYPNML